MSTKQDTDANPVFAEQWQAEALAMADLLIQGGQLDAKEWAQTLSDQLREFQNDEEADTPENYYQAVLAALGSLLNKNQLLSEPELAQRQSDWEQAYLSTPHGQPVALACGA